jgi:hypothetical protein
MKREFILKTYKISLEEYQKTCKVLGLEDNPEEVTGIALGDFDTVRSWFDEKVVKDHREAAAKLQESKAPSGFEAEIVNGLGDRIDQKARQGVEEIMGAISVSGVGMTEMAMARYRKTFVKYATSPEIEQKYFTPAVEGGQLPANFSQPSPPKEMTQTLRPSAD